MEKSISNCPQCREPYSSSLPKTSHYMRCGLPLTLHCGHGVCYHCIVSKRSHPKHHGTVSSNKGPDSTTISCAVCKCVSVIPHEAVQNVLAVINCYQLGLIQLNELGIDMAAENIGFKDGSRGLFVPSSPELVVERPQLLNPPGKCPIHNTSIDFWCYNDELLLCGGCRISCHLGHDVVRLLDRNKDELESFYEAADEAVELVGNMKKTCSYIKGQSERVKLEYDLLIKQLRGHFAELHTLLASREQQMQHELFQRFQERTGSLNNAERHIREGQLDLSKRLQKATKAVSSDIPPSRSAIARLTESIRQSNSCKKLVDETRDNVNSVTLSALFEPNEEYAHHLRHDPVATVRSEYEGASYWNRLLSQFDDFKQEKDRQSQDHLSSTSPCEPTEKKRARKHTHMNSSPLAVNHYESGMHLTGRVVHVEDKCFYIQVHTSPSPDGDGGPKELKKLQTQIQTCEKNPAPRLSELQLGQLVAGRFHGKWYRALIEEINFNCEDLAIFFVDYGNRKFTTVQSIRLLGDGMSDLPAQAVRCSQTDSKTSISRTVSKFVNVHVVRVDPGGVGRSDGQEYTLWVTVYPSPVDENITSTITPPKESVDPFTAYTPMKLHKAVRTLPTPPPPEAIVAKRKRFPAKDWVPRTPCSGPSDLAYGSDHHRPAPVPSIHTSAKSAFRASPVPSQSPVYVPPPPALHEGQENRFRTKVVVSHLNSVGEFYIQIDKAQETYANLTQQLDVHFANASLLLEQLNQADMKTVGLICAANVDGHWNRCRIVDIVDDKTVTLYLTDVGKKTKVNCTQLYRLSQPRWMETPALALECRLWGVRPAGHVTKWSGSAADKMTEAIKKCSALFVQVYFVQEELDDTGLFQSVHYVRFYHEYIKPGGPLEFDQTLTGCLNDELLDRGLALRDPMLVTLQPSPKRWLPSVTLPPELEGASPVWMDDDGRLYIHRPSGPTNHVPTINKLINWHYEKSTPTPADLAHWVKDEPCIVLYRDRKWYRAVVLTADDEATSAFVLFVDYGNSEEVSYENMRKSLLCYEYPIQASRCRLSRYPGPETKPTDVELEMLHQILIDQAITVRVLEPATSGSDPVVDIWFPDEGAKDLKEIFQQLRPAYRYSGTRSKASGSPEVESSPPVIYPRGPGTPAPTVPLSSVDLDDSIFDANSSEFSDDVYPIFNFDVFLESREMDVYRPLFIPRRVSLPIRIISFDYEQCQGVFSPERLSFGDSPKQWQEQVEGYARLSAELQRAAPLFPDLGVVESGSPCTCRYPEDGRWQRGKVLGYDDDNLEYLRIELVDLGMNVKLRKYKIKQLATEYLGLPRHSAKAKIIYAVVPTWHPPDFDFIRSLHKKGKHSFVSFFREVNEPLQMKLLYKDCQGKLIPAIE